MILWLKHLRGLKFVEVLWNILNRRFFIKTVVNVYSFYLSSFILKSSLTLNFASFILILSLVFPDLFFFGLFYKLIFYVGNTKNLVHLLVEKDNLVVLSDDYAVVVHF